MSSTSVAVGQFSEEFVSADVNPSLQGSLMPLATPGEIHARNETLEVHICDIEAISGERVLQALKAIPGRDEVNILHLRRFANRASLPPHVRSPDTTNDSGESLDKASKKKNPVVTIILAPTSLISGPELIDLLIPLKLSVNGQSLHIRTAKVPAHAPTSIKYAEEFSRKLWPTNFMNSNAFGPHPSIVVSNQAELNLNAGKWMALAHRLGAAAQAESIGIGVGVVFIETVSGTQEVVAGAGDSRLCHRKDACPPLDKTSGTPAKHAVLRALDLLARKRRHVLKTDGDKASHDSSVTENPFNNDASLSPLEQRILEKVNLKPGGYLALDLDVYVTHEPCVMCCMALIHSRIGRCVFGSWMPKTGGFGCDAEGRHIEQKEVAPSQKAMGIPEASFKTKPTEKSESNSLDYGLFWRSDLNWRFLAWHFSCIMSDPFASLPEDTHV